MSTGRWSLMRWIVDLGLLTGALFLSNWAKWTLPFGQTPDPGTRFVTPLILVILLASWSVFGRVTALYHPRPATTLAQELQRTVGTFALTLVTVAAVFLMLKYYFYSRLLLVYFFVTAVLFMAAFRLALWRAWSFWRSHPHGTRRVLIVGGGEYVERLGHALRERPWENVQVVGVAADSPADTDLPLLGPTSAVSQIVREQGVDEVIIAEQERASVVQVVRTLQTLPVRVKVVPSYLELGSVAAVVSTVGDIPLLELRSPAIDDVDAFLKRALDLIVSAVALVVLSPVMVVSGLLIKLTSRGPAVFRQERVGENGRIFTIYKLRTMTVDAPATPPVPEHPDELGQSRIKVSPGDRHITGVGRVLRRFTLDELPQFMNVLKGEMSLVGPRPEVPPVVQLYNPWQLKRLEAKPGITGPMQVNGAGDLPLDDRVKLELMYIQSYTVWEDVKILARTLAAVIGGKGVR